MTSNFRVRRIQLVTWARVVKENGNYPGRIDFNEAKKYGLENILKTLNNRRKVRSWCLQRSLEELIAEIVKQDVADNEEYFCYLTEKEAEQKLLLNSAQLIQIIELGKKQKMIKVLKRTTERRICYIIIRKFPPELL